MLRTPIEDFELSVRSVNSLKNSSIRTLGDLVRQSESQILQVKNFGKKSLNEIADLLERGGMTSIRALLSRLAAGETVAAAAPGVYGWRLTELESQWRRQLGG